MTKYIVIFPYKGIVCENYRNFNEDLSPSCWSIFVVAIKCCTDPNLSSGYQ